MKAILDIRDHRDAIDGNDAVLYFGRDRLLTTRGLQFALRKNGHNIMVQIQYTGPLDSETPDMSSATWDMLTERELEVVVALVPQIKFGLTNWVYIVRVEHNRYELIYRHRPPPSIINQTWAPLVDANEIEVHRWLMWDEGEGVHNGRDVRFRYVWCDHPNEIEDLLSEYYSNRRLQDLDLTFPILALITLEDRVVGFMQERWHGRGITYDDRELIYEAVARIQRAGILFYLIEPGNIVIVDDNKVRFAALEWTMHQFSLDDPEEVETLEQDAEIYHWTRLREIFDEMREWPEGAGGGLVQTRTDTFLFFPQAMYKIPDAFWSAIAQGVPHSLFDEMRKLLREVAAELTIQSKQAAKKKRKQKASLIARPVPCDSDSEDRPLVVSARRPSMLAARGEKLSSKRMSEQTRYNFFKCVGREQMNQKQAAEEDSNRFEEISD
ncbi:hypothetical protein OE88DRAFT_1664630 [Heliocybe sulcata]|uniref:Uncharacterized protein n=1 Tax=Heliocybe sulcata TaxID=5364 RepID=A0A5C3MWR3_9AGAM|nr:hypothetical protein OE88DRAFT_1664630 [Heliocybe sulcata]